MKELFGVVIVAAGKGSRMRSSESKQYLSVGGQPILIHTLKLFDGIPGAGPIVLVCTPGDEERCISYIRDYGITRPIKVIAGGKERQESVYRGLQALPASLEWVLVHDAVRPFTEPAHVLACLERAQETGAAVLAVPVKDTIKLVDESGRIQSTPDRKLLWSVQTPQAFRLSELLAVHRRADEEGFVGTDDAMLAERSGIPVLVAEGSYTNIKITTPEDLEWAEFFLERQKKANTTGTSDRRRNY